MNIPQEVSTRHHPSDVDQIVLELVTVGHLPSREELGDARQAGPDELPACKPRDLPDVQLLPPSPGMHNLLFGLRSGSHKTHVPDKDVPDLRELIQGRLAQQPTNSGDPWIVTAGLHLHLRRIFPHRAELQGPKQPPVPANPLLAEEDRPTILPPDSRYDDDPKREAD